MKGIAGFSLWVVLLTGDLVVGLHEYNCGKSWGKNCTGNNAGQCCDTNGYCGTTDAFCGDTCSEEYGPCNLKIKAEDYHCGESWKKVCTGAYTGQCCNTNTYCGTTDAYCGETCVDDYGWCSRKGLANDYDCGKLWGKNCTGTYAGQCCNSDGNCGTTDDYCGEFCLESYGPCNWKAGAKDYNCGKVWGKRCTGGYSGFCCNTKGLCGTSKDECGETCLEEYGPCPLKCTGNTFTLSCWYDLLRKNGFRVKGV